MFGRAGRRGLDEKGFALWSGDSPRLGEAKPLQLKRGESLDWPAFLALMHRAPDPQAAAQKLAGSLFTREPVQLALEQLTLPEVVTAPALPVVIREIEEMCGHNGIWQRLRPSKVVPLTEAFILVKGEWHPALTKPDSLRGVVIGTPCRLPMADGSVRHGRAVPLAHFPKTGETDRLEPADWLRKALLKLEGPRGPRRQWKLETLEKEILPLLPKLTQGGQAFGELYVLRDAVQVRLDYSKANVRVIPDADEQPLINPLRRSVQKEDIHLGTVLGGGHISAARAGRLWLKLGLIDAAARPTRRGEIASLFQHGEGLAVAAALEDETYDVKDLAWDLAELRAGERVAAGGRSSSRLGACCRLTFKSLTAEGYLRDGLPESFGEGCAEVLRGFVLHGKLPPPDAEGRGPGTGDLERAILEWRSTLRLIAHGSAHPWERWRALSAAAREVLAKVGPKKV
jgi:hypothetical protein